MLAPDSALTFAAQSVFVQRYGIRTHDLLGEPSMGLFDGALGDMAGSLLGGKAGGIEQMLGGLLGKNTQGGASSSAMLTMAMTLVQQNGGIAGLVQKMQGSGLGDIVSSWVGTGANQAVSASQLESALGSTVVTKAAAQAGVDPSQAMGGLAAMLPQLIDKLTPDGNVNAGSNAMLTQVMGMLRGK